MRSSEMKSASPANRAWYCVSGVAMKKMICTHDEIVLVDETLILIDPYIICSQYHGHWSPGDTEPGEQLPWYWAIVPGIIWALCMRVRYWHVKLWNYGELCIFWGVLYHPLTLVEHSMLKCTHGIYLSMDITWWSQRVDILMKTGNKSLQLFR